jgi:para-aminobenzoate synthetase component 2
LILVIDNYDSFTFNLVQYIGCTGKKVTVFRNDKISLEEIGRMTPEKIVISPGPGYPDEAGIALEVVKTFKEKCPILGVCLGHQVIGQAFGGKIVEAESLFHGKSSSISHDGKTIYNNLKNPFEAGRYHSLVVDKKTLPSCLEISAQTEDGTIMGIRHRDYPVEGVQFHPESILTEGGMQLIENFLKL